jgi:hypothetical protein
MERRARVLKTLGESLPLLVAVGIDVAPVLEEFGLQAPDGVEAPEPAPVPAAAPDAPAPADAEEPDETEDNGDD